MHSTAQTTNNMDTREATHAHAISTGALHPTDAELHNRWKKEIFEEFFPHHLENLDSDANEWQIRTKLQAHCFFPGPKSLQEDIRHWETDEWGKRRAIEHLQYADNCASNPDIPRSLQIIAMVNVLTMVTAWKSLLPKIKPERLQKYDQRLREEFPNMDDPWAVCFDRKPRTDDPVRLRAVANEATARAEATPTENNQAEAKKAQQIADEEEIREVIRVAEEADRKEACEARIAAKKKAEKTRIAAEQEAWCRSIEDKNEAERLQKELDAHENTSKTTCTVELDDDDEDEKWIVPNSASSDFDSDSDSDFDSEDDS